MKKLIVSLICVFVLLLCGCQKRFCAKEINEITPAQTQESVMTKPPELTVANRWNSVKAALGRYSLTAKEKDGKSSSVIADSSHPLEFCMTAPSVGVKPTPMSSVDPLVYYLQFETAPDRVEVRYWCDEEWEKDSPTETYIDVDMTNFAIKVPDTDALFEVVAYWNGGDEFCGEASYIFKSVHRTLMIDPLPEISVG